MHVFHLTFAKQNALVKTSYNSNHCKYAYPASQIRIITIFAQRNPINFINVFQNKYVNILASGRKATI